MITLILTVAMQAAPAPKPVAQVQPCVWPNKCVSAPVAQVQPCVWPNKCAAAPAVVTPVAQVQTCVWPHKCAAHA